MFVYSRWQITYTGLPKSIKCTLKAAINKFSFSSAISLTLVIFNPIPFTRPYPFLNVNAEHKPTHENQQHRGGAHDCMPNCRMSSLEIIVVHISINAFSRIFLSWYMNQCRLWLWGNCAHIQRHCGCSRSSHMHYFCYFSFFRKLPCQTYVDIVMHRSHPCCHAGLRHRRHELGIADSDRI